MSLYSPPRHTNFYSAAALGCVITWGALVCVNLRWKYLPTIWRKEARLLPTARVKGSSSNSKRVATKKRKRKPLIVLLHGMWHDATWFGDLQSILRDQGYTSIAVDLLPGERFLVGFTQTEIVEDLERTLKYELEGNEAAQELVLVGHSQGGLVVQSCLSNSSWIHENTNAVVLMATYPLGNIASFRKITSQTQSLCSHWGVLSIFLLGRIMSLSYLKALFLLPTTDTDESKLQRYTEKILKAPSDGMITMSHFLLGEKEGVISSKPTLVLGAQDDIIYPPHLVRDGFDARFPKATHIVVPNQAHCFMDPPENSTPAMPDSLLGWLNRLYTAE